MDITMIMIKTPGVANITSIGVTVVSPLLAVADEGYEVAWFFPLRFACKALDGTAVGWDGVRVGTREGTADGVLVRGICGRNDGLELGTDVGTVEYGEVVGLVDGDIVITLDGSEVGSLVVDEADGVDVVTTEVGFDDGSELLLVLCSDTTRVGDAVVGKVTFTIESVSVILDRREFVKGRGICIPILFFRIRKY